jgi:hypothetical protein
VGAHAAPPARGRAERIAPWTATGGFVGELAMNGLQECRFTKTDALNAN